MVDELAFVQAIAALPDDDGPRLLFADYLDERGDPLSLARAEFIRVQCALAHPPHAAVIARLWQRERELLETHWRTWLRPICQALGEPLPIANAQRERHSLHWLDTPQQAHMLFQPWAGRETAYLYSGQFRRGFFAHAALVAKPYRGPQHIARLVERTPIDGLTLIQYPTRELTTTVLAAHTEQLRSLELLYPDSAGVAAVLQIPGLITLREFVVRAARNSAGLADVLARYGAFTQLRTLSINTCELPETALWELLHTPWMQRLDRLDLVACGLTDRHLRILAEVWPPTLRHIDVSANQFTNRGWSLITGRCPTIVASNPADRPWPERYYWSH